MAAPNGFAAVPRGFANLEFLDWLAEMDSINNLWEDEEIIADDVAAQDGGAAGDEEDAPEANVAGDEENSDDDDDGIIADVSDDDDEVEITEKYLRSGHPRNELFCATITFVSVETRDGEEHNICQGCYMAYQLRVEVAYHRHTDFHITTRFRDVDREYCKCCRDPLYLIRPVAICNICNNNKKKYY